MCDSREATASASSCSPCTTSAASLPPSARSDPSGSGEIRRWARPHPQPHSRVAAHFWMTTTQIQPRFGQSADQQLLGTIFNLQGVLIGGAEIAVKWLSARLLGLGNGN